MLKPIGTVATPVESDNATRHTLLLVLNGLLFQIGWFSAVLGGNNIALAVTLALLVIHHLVFINSHKQWLLIAAITLLGLAVDTTLSLAGVLIFSQVQFGIPLWLLCIWVLFACTLNHSLAWLKNKPLLAVFVGAAAGPWSYFAGSKLSDVAFGEPLLQSLTIIIIVWAALLPSLMLLSTKLANRH